MTPAISSAGEGDKTVTETALTKKQKMVLDFIESRYVEAGRPPTYEEIAARFKWRSANSVTNHVAALREKGYIAETAGRNRHVMPTRIVRMHPRQTSRIPLIGSIAAGAPIEAIENVETWFEWDALGVTNERGDKFALRVKGNSMVNRGIRNGDIVVVQRQSFVTRRDVAAVRMGSEVTLKYVKQEANSIKLIPDNDFVAPMIVAPTDDFEVMGKVVRLFREDI
ncbi:MAG TPA: transcriptional repressor LexA [Chitinivibrionales bacterium]|jgi:repressor LexA|nr:transcriptional repressor LexA [Chitinivibrionales bacterium]